MRLFPKVDAAIDRKDRAALLTGIFDLAFAVTIYGPFVAVAADVFLAGGVVGQVFVAGGSSGQLFIAGAPIGEVN